MKNLLNSESFLIGISFAAIYLIWGGTYILNDWSLETFPPFILAGSRFLIAGLLLGLFFTRSLAVLDWRSFINATAIGILLLGIGTGAITYAIQYIDTGLAALVVAFEPLLVVLLMWIVHRQQPTWMTTLGLTLGIVGMTVLVTQHTIVTNEQTLFGIAVIFISLISWAVGSVYMSKITLPSSKGASASIQMMASGIFLMIFSVIVGEDFEQIYHAFQWRAILSWITLILFGSIVAYSAFNYLLLKSTPDKVATTTYVNPVVALFLGWSLNHEQITGQSLAAAAILLSGVFFINTGKRKSRKLRWKA